MASPIRKQDGLLAAILVSSAWSSSCMSVSASCMLLLAWRSAVIRITIIYAVLVHSLGIGAAWLMQKAW